ncbi:hypothetical protein WJX73_003098 [Symbiochloris irregularis]|uniref:BAT2 N-terminal domain-containing protein n=1 Tax=Symbiochloris irregularis TaxID=706552 RepID=A0AAW1PGQ6_9CHLO
MSQQRTGGQQYANSNINTVLSRSGASSPSQTSIPRYGPGLVSLGAPKRPRSNAAGPGGKLAVPKPVNLPSLKKENSGNDPNTQLVPSSSSGARGSWKQPEEPQQQQPAPDARTSALTAGSNWAGPGKSPGQPLWQPPEGPYPTAASLPPRDRHLNPHEYPTLSTAAQSRPHLPRQPLPSVAPASAQGLSKWDEDERQIPAARSARPPSDWIREQENLRDAPPPWEEQRFPPQTWRSGPYGGPEAEAFPSPPLRSPQGRDADHWQPPPSDKRGGLPPLAGGMQQRPYGVQPPYPRGGARFSNAEFPALPLDQQLFPPPPSAREDAHLPHGNAASPSAPVAPPAAHDPEREAFEAELQRAAADMEKERQRKLEEKRAVPVPPPAPAPPPTPAQPQPPLAPAVPDVDKDDRRDAPAGHSGQMQSQGAGASEGQPAAAEVEPAADKEAEEDPAAAFEASRLRALSMRAQREAASEEADRQRKVAAQAKLVELEERIARRKAEQAAKAAAAEEREAAEKAALEQEAALAATPLPADNVLIDSVIDQLPASSIPGRKGLGPTHDSLAVNLSGSLGRELDKLADTTTAAAVVSSSRQGSEIGAPESPLGPPATAADVEAAIETLDGQAVGRAWLERRSPAQEELHGRIPNGLPAPQVPSNAAGALEDLPDEEDPAIKGTVPQAGAGSSPREAVAPAAAAVDTHPSAADAQAAAAAALQGAGSARQGRGNRERGPRAPRDGPAGERGERARGGRGRDRDRGRNRGRKREGDHAGEDGASKPLTAEGSEEMPSAAAASTGAGGDGRRPRGRGRASSGDPAAAVDGGPVQGPRGGRGRGKAAMSPRGSASAAAAAGGAAQAPQTAPTRIIKPPGLPAASNAAGLVPTGEALGQPSDSHGIAQPLQGIADTLTAPPAPPHAPQQPPFVWGNFSSVSGGSDDGGPSTILDIVAPSAVHAPAGPDLSASPLQADRTIDRPRSAAAGAVPGGGSPLSNAAGGSGLPSMPPAGAFGSPFGQGGVQFGQLPFSQTGAPFVPTGKKPDWSTGPIASSGSGGPALSRALDSAGPQLGGFHQQNGGLPQPPGLNRGAGGRGMGPPMGRGRGFDSGGRRGNVRGNRMDPQRVSSGASLPNPQGMRGAPPHMTPRGMAPPNLGARAPMQGPNPPPPAIPARGLSKSVLLATVICKGVNMGALVRTAVLVLLSVCFFQGARAASSSSVAAGEVFNPMANQSGPHGLPENFLIQRGDL